MDNKRSGRSTRLVDEYIQILFSNRGEYITILDHYDSRSAHWLLITRILQRMRIEHPREKLDLDKSKLRLKLL